MPSAALTSPPPTSTRLVVDTDVASFVFKWHPRLAAPYVTILRGFELIVSFMTLAEMRQGALDANWGPRKREVLDLYLAEFSVLHSDDALCSIWGTVRNQRARIGRPISSADAWIAASALFLSAPLVTNNPRDFEYLEDLRIISLDSE